MAFLKYFLILAFAVNGAEILSNIEENNVTELTKATFNEFIHNNNYTLVYFYTNSCQVCDEFKFVIQRIANKLKNDKIEFGSVNLTEQPDLIVKLKTSKRPVFKFYVYGKHVVYHGPMHEESIYHFLIRQSSNHCEELVDEHDLIEFSGMSKSLIFFLSEDDEESLEVFEALASAYKGLPFRYTFDSSLKEKYSTATRALVFFRKYNDGHIVLGFEEPLTSDLLMSFVDSHLHEYVVPISEAMDFDHLGLETGGMIYFGNLNDEPEYETFITFAKHKRHSFKFLECNIQNGLCSNFLEMINISKDNLPAVYILYDDSHDIKKLDVESVTKEAMNDAIRRFKHGGYVKYTKSQSTTLTKDSLIKTVVSDNFEELVIKNDKWVLLKAYSPWCNTCKQYNATFHTIAELLKDQNDIVVAKIDATLNDHKYIEVDVHPTIFIFEPGKKHSPRVYEGPQEIEYIINELEVLAGKTLPHLEQQITDEL